MRRKLIIHSSTKFILLSILLPKLEHHKHKGKPEEEEFRKGEENVTGPIGKKLTYSRNRKASMIM